ncbi:hypothetical protein MBM_07565 [Drepanopeziza brunnea f. sp. 'multigermtubi' MB_m1]|uniref:Uncharacterized protein n=1 Tax=Marssonina brunnea f. sp. multigermtubi (strain MB_m1) TaxID=1072389 RepID=K1WAM2_MARBU|nr:uncharacterized protein MBM_07565 [Drepanopeziza brunnea f. sp. 'multigermtubi' MB_m1]EKD14335.1 hypothetical protein MBM_07565 [Drepanopeziza brunnea f. sp. 'multigermtubi' MB_m1]
MSWFGSIGLGGKIGIVLGALVVLAFLASLIRLLFIKRRFRKDKEKAEVEAAARIDEEKLIGRPFGEGDLSGVRALEHGYFGSFSQSSSHLLSPNTMPVDVDQAGTYITNSVPSIVVSIPQTLSPPATPNRTKRKHSTSSLESPNNKKSSRLNYEANIIGGRDGVYTLPHSSQSNEKTFGERPTRVNPLSSPNSRPISYLPKFTFSGEIEDSGLLVPTREKSRNIKSVATSFAGSEASSAAPPPPVARRPSPKSTPLSIFPPSINHVPNVLPRGGPRSIFPASGSHERSDSHPKNQPNSQFAACPVPLHDLAPQAVTIDPRQFSFPRDTRSWNSSSPTLSQQAILVSLKFSGPVSDRNAPESPVFCDPVVRKKRVSIFQPSHSRRASADGQRPLTRVHSMAASCIHSNRTSIMDSDTLPQQHSLTRSCSRSRSFSPSRSLSCSSSQPRTSNRNRSRSTSRERSESPRSLSRTHGSLRRYSRSSSEFPDSWRCSRDRDSMHYDPMPASCTSAVSARGRASSFENPLDLGAGQGIRGRSDSVGSRASLTEFYDAYYRRLARPRKASGVSQARGVAGGGSLVKGNGGGSGKRPPPPLKLIGTIVEVASPVPSPMTRVPNMI